MFGERRTKQNSELGDLRGAERWWRTAATAMHWPTAHVVPVRVAVTMLCEERFVRVMVSDHPAATLGDHQAAGRLFHTISNEQLLNHPSPKRLGLDAQDCIECSRFLPGFEQLDRRARQVDPGTLIGASTSWAGLTSTELLPGQAQA